MIYWAIGVFIAISLAILLIDNAGRRRSLRVAILKGINDLEESAYGYELNLWVQDELERRVSIGEFYTAVYALERKGLIATSQIPGGPERGFRSKLLCKLTEEGLAEILVSDRKERSV